MAHPTNPLWISSRFLVSLPDICGRIAPSPAGARALQRQRSHLGRSSKSSESSMEGPSDSMFELFRTRNVPHSARWVPAMCSAICRGAPRFSTADFRLRDFANHRGVSNESPDPAMLM